MGATPLQPAAPLVVDRCVCADVTFDALAAMARRDPGTPLDLDTLRRRTGCCAGCGLCEPYVRLMLRTGRTAFALGERAE